MTGAANNGAPTRMEISLVLQGGGALGAYEWGAINALFDVIDEAIANGGDITLRGAPAVSSFPDRSRLVPPNERDRQGQVGLVLKPLPASHQVLI